MTDPESDKPDTKKPGHAHQPDGTDSSDQWDAQIADENMVPDADPSAQK